MSQSINGTIGRLITLLELAVSFWFVFSAWNNGMVPGKYILIICVVALLVFAVTFGLQFVHNERANITGMIISVVFLFLFAIGVFSFTKLGNMLKSIGGATYKIDRMVVVVRKDDPAQSLTDAKDYLFGRQTSLDQENTDQMIDKVRDEVGQELSILTYDTMVEEAQALLNGEIEAAVYNEAFVGMIEEEIEGYADQVRTLNHLEIKTKIESVEDQDITKPFSIFISGIDVSGPITTTSRSDVNIIATVNPETKQILLTSTPRDYYVPISGISGGQRDKLTHAGIYGVDRSIATLEELYDIDISYYGRVNFSSFLKIVDALGGVDVESDYAFTSKHGNFTFTKGMNHMNGEQALGFVRERYSFGDGDNQRGKNQQKVLTAIIQKALSPAILTGANGIINSVGDSVETNMTSEKIAEFINMQLADGGGWNIVSANATGTGDTQTCYSTGSSMLYVMRPNESSVAEIKKKMQQVLDGEIISE